MTYRKTIIEQAAKRFFGSKTKWAIYLMLFVLIDRGFSFGIVPVDVVDELIVAFAGLAVWSLRDAVKPAGARLIRTRPAKDY